MGVVTALTYACCQIRCRITFEADSQNAPWRWRSVRLKEKGSALRKQFCLASAWSGNNGPIFFRTNHFQRIRFQSFNPDGFPILTSNSA
jgi:hypothetical protein